MSVRVRFAPSPTGYLPIGGARTALFNWLYARHCGGRFILRIEDTDQARNTREAVDLILNGLRWLGLDWDEGPVTGEDFHSVKGDRGPYFQSLRHDIYQRYVQDLKDRDMAYEKEGAVKFRMTREPVTIPDQVVGDVERKLTDREENDPDFVIVRSDGQPVFHLVNVVDDLEMGITHVIRGEDHLSNTNKHIALCRALDRQPPAYAHIPLILNPDGTKMSKRDTGASLETYMEGFFMPEAVVNYLCLLGWSPKDDRQILPIEEVIERFDLPQILRANARFDMDKLQWINGEYLKSVTQEKFNTLCLRELSRADIRTEGYDMAYVHSALGTYREKYQQLIENPSSAQFYFSDDFPVDESLARETFTAENKQWIERLKEKLKELETFDADSIQSVFKPLAKELGIKVGALVLPTRVALTGSKVGPSLYHLMEVLGRDKVLTRLDKAYGNVA